MDSRPLLWSLLDPEGASARWADVEEVERSEAPTGPVDVLDAATLKARFGPASLWFWRIARYLRLRWPNHDTSLTEADMETVR